MPLGQQYGKKVLMCSIYRSQQGSAEAFKTSCAGAEGLLDSLQKYYYNHIKYKFKKVEAVLYFFFSIYLS